jgi:hypothetical protein
MANWQAPTTHNERAPEDVGLLVHQPVRPYLDAGTGRVKWWTGGGALPGGATPLSVVVRAGDSRRVFSTDNAGERTPVLFGASTILFR